MKRIMLVLLITTIFMTFLPSCFVESEADRTYRAEQSQKKLEAEREAERQRIKEERKQKAYDIAEYTAEQVVENFYGGGKAIDWDLDKWNFNEYKNEYKIEMSINWAGYTFGGYYAISGIARSDDEELTWTGTWQNEKAETFAKFYNFVEGAAMVLDALSEE